MKNLPYGIHLSLQAELDSTTSEAAPSTSYDSIDMENERDAYP